MEAAKPQQQREEEQERKVSMEKTVKVFSSEEDADSSWSDASEPVQNHRGWKAMPYVIGASSIYLPYSSFIDKTCVHIFWAGPHLHCIE
jgi:hypothetical protein